MSNEIKKKHTLKETKYRKYSIKFLDEVVFLLLYR